MRPTARALSTAVTATAVMAVGLGTAASAAASIEERARVPAQERATVPADESADVPADESARGPAWVPEEEPTDAPPIPDEEPSDELAEKSTDPWAEESAGTSAEDSAGASPGTPADDWSGTSPGTKTDDWSGTSTEKAPGASPSASATAPVAEVTPRTVAPGDTVTISVSCGALGGPAPKSIDAHSQAFEHGTAKLHLVEGKDKAAAPAYTGTARIASAANFEKGGGGKEGRTDEWSVDGACPAPPGGKEAEWSATFTVTRDGSHHPHGVRAGKGGAFTDSPAALAAGGLLIAGALGAAVHRLLRREPSANR
ncbi:hypothetical protein [Streptomyces sp. NBC_00286]|uniref:hypothetical protein n=1 Tax=Streptomyces sp. NBC_00286 TaxID=2975701 RepID=UPI002E2BB0E4|nr:hypothetical protein [Streptomyces sp. NBC_00286]